MSGHPMAGKEAKYLISPGLSTLLTTGYRWSPFPGFSRDMLLPSELSGAPRTDNIADQGAPMVHTKPGWIPPPELSDAPRTVNIADQRAPTVLPGSRVGTLASEASEGILTGDSGVTIRQVGTSYSFWFFFWLICPS